MTGEPGPPESPLAGGPDGCWSRGLAWSIAGLAEAYNETSDAAVLDTLRRSVSYYVGAAPDLIPP
ncbi:MAG: hypothetical protein JWM85_2647 [Acidimicrobiaceae bacterium]|nr:hypothetical protein [Acidimicrobiaceae bacterium]